MTDDPQRKKDGWLPELDGLRGIAALAVVMVHFHGSIPPADGPPPWAFLERTCVANMAVVCFYVLSSFLLTTLAYRAGPSFSPVRFYQRRIARIWPLYFAVIVACLWLIPAFAGGMPIHELPYRKCAWAREQWWVWGAFLTNWPIAWDGIAGVTNQLPSPLTVLWSIAVEEQFYVFFPLLFIAIQRNYLSFQSLAGAALFGGLIFRAWMIWLGQEAPGNSGMYYASGSYVDVFFCGAVAGYLYSTRSDLSLRGRWIPWLALATLLVIGYFWSSVLLPPYDEFGAPGWALVLFVYPITALLFCVLILWSLTNRDAFLSRLLRSRPARLVGVVSFGLYVLHPLVQPVSHRVLAHLAGLNGLQLPMPEYALITIVHCLFCLCIAAVSYLLFERPFLELTQRASSSHRHHHEADLVPWLMRVPLVAIAMSAVLLVVSMACVLLRSSTPTITAAG